MRPMVRKMEKMKEDQEMEKQADKLKERSSRAGYASAWPEYAPRPMSDYERAVYDIYNNKDYIEDYS